jgi:hypothetical protein
MTAAAADPYTLPLDKLDPSSGSLFQQQHWAYFERLRKEDPVHFVDSEEFGPNGIPGQFDAAHCRG